MPDGSLPWQNYFPQTMITKELGEACAGTWLEEQRGD
jgi:hypothetical protein